MKLYVRIHAGNRQIREREAKPAEILAAARPLADLEAAQREFERQALLGTRKANLADSIQSIVLAALGADDE